MDIIIKQSLLFIAIGIACACAEKKPDRFEKLVDESSGFSFTNTLQESDTLNAFELLYIYNGSGVGIGDLNNDGLMDIVMGANMSQSEIFINQGNLQFKKLPPDKGFVSKGWVHGVSMVDINNDGHLDIYLSVGGKHIGEPAKNQLFVNNGDLTFTESAAMYGLDDDRLTSHTVFFDMDKDGDLDAYLMNYENNPDKDPNLVTPKKVMGDTPSNDRLYINDNGFFKDHSLKAGIVHEGYGLGIAVHDFNLDGWLDLYISNDFAYDDLLYINNQDGTFSESLQSHVSHTSNFGMGLDVGDINNDGFADFIQLDMLPEDNRRQKKLLSGLNYDRQQLLLQRGYTPQYMRNALQLNDGNGNFKEIGFLAGIHATDWSWTPLMADLNNDGLQDIFITNGYVKDVTDVDFRDYIVNESRKRNQPFDPQLVVEILRDLKGEKVSNYAFSNLGDYQFENHAEAWGLSEPSFSTGAAYADLDNDGDLDLIISNLNASSSIYENHSTTIDSAGFLSVNLTVNQQHALAIGAKVQLYSPKGEMVRWMSPYRGFQSSVDPRLHFGLGDDKKIDSLAITWPDGRREVLIGPQANQHLSFNKKGLGVFEPKIVVPPVFLWNDASATVSFDYDHKESGFVDFKREALLPHQLSMEGPVAASADINGDGRGDFFIGGAAGQESSLWVQKANVSGNIIQRKSFPWHKSSEVTDALFYDFDGDGDMDLYVVSGSNEFDGKNAEYQDRLYLNDGEGNFVPTKNILPEAPVSGSVIAASDITGNGELELFIGGRLNPGNYPLPGTSQLLVKEGDKYVDKIDEWMPGLKHLGMVKAATWADLNNDGTVELIVTGEFMSIHVFERQGAEWTDQSIKFGTEGHVGWWNTLKIADINQDGYLDILAGNVGLNSRYQASDKYPLRIYASDYDANGSLDAIMTYENEQGEFIIHDRTTLSSQITAIKKKFPQNIDYAEAYANEVIPQKDLDNAYQLEATEFASGVFLNDSGSLTFTPFPMEAQFSPVNDMLLQDVNNDGHLDILTAGNSYSPEVFNGRQDAQTSLLILGNGDGSFLPVNQRVMSPILSQGVISQFLEIDMVKEDLVLVLKNNDKAGLLKLNKKVQLNAANY